MAQNYGTLGSPTITTIPLLDRENLHIGFPLTAGETYYLGETVKLKSDGTVTIAGPTDRILGIVVSNYKKEDATVVVQTQFAACVTAIISAGANTNDEVAFLSWDLTTGKPVYRLAATGDRVTGICLGLSPVTSGTPGIYEVGVLTYQYTK